MQQVSRTVVSLGTTDVPERDGRFCCCAIDSEGGIEYGIKTYDDLPPGAVVRRSATQGWEPTGEHRDLNEILTPLRPKIRKWEVRRDDVDLRGQRVLRFQAGDIFEGLIRWYPREAETPRSPACPVSDVNKLVAGRGLSRVTEVVELGLQLYLVVDGNNQYFEHYSSSAGTFRCKYNGKGPPPKTLPPGSLLAVFLSDHDQNPDRVVIPAHAKSRSEFTRERYWYLKIGSVLLLQAGKAPQGPQGTSGEPDVRAILNRAIRERRQVSVVYWSKLQGAMLHLDVIPHEIQEPRLGSEIAEAVLLATVYSTGTRNRFPLSQFVSVRLA